MSCLPLLIIAAGLGQTPVKLSYYEQLKDAQRMPVVFSPNDASMLYFTRTVDKSSGEAKLKHTYHVADIDGKNSRAVFESPIEWDDFLNAVTTDHAFSSDGKRIVVATTDNGKGMRDQENPGRAVPAIVSEDGKTEIIPCELGSCGGFGFMDGGLLVLDTPGLISGQGYQLRLHNEGGAKAIQSDEKVAASCLRISPDRRKAAFFVSKHIGSAIVRLRQVNLETGDVKDSPEFRTYNATFDGRPQLFWDDASEGVFCHVSTREQSKWPFELTHYRIDTQQGEVVSSQRNVGASCTLGSGRLAIWHPESDGCSVLDTRSGKSISLPNHNYILGGRGNRVVVADLERNAIYAAQINVTDSAKP